MPAPKTKPGAAEAEEHNHPDHGPFVAPPAGPLEPLAGAVLLRARR
jgi:hypothetical protein